MGNVGQGKEGSVGVESGSEGKVGWRSREGGFIDNDYNILFQGLEGGVETV